MQEKITESENNVWKHLFFIVAKVWLNEFTLAYNFLEEIIT